MTAENIEEREAGSLGTYECFACKQTFDLVLTEDEARAQWEVEFPGMPFDSTPKDVVCDECFKTIMADEDDDATNDLRDKVRAAITSEKAAVEPL